MRVLIVGEGNSESQGALEAFVQRLAGPLECDCAKVNQNIGAVHGKGKAYEKRAIRWLYEAVKRGYDALVLLIDQDNCPERNQQLADAQEYQTVSLRRAFGVAIRTFDAWMLADEQALTHVLGYTIQRQPDPETLTDPKSICTALLHDCALEISANEMYARVARSAAIEIIEDRCPKGFGTFAGRVRAI
jgi:hypothetical protein